MEQGFVVPSFVLFLMVIQNHLQSYMYLSASSCYIEVEQVLRNLKSYNAMTLNW
jgi:hypothetical protein